MKYLVWALSVSLLFTSYKLKLCENTLRHCYDNNVMVREVRVFNLGGK